MSARNYTYYDFTQSMCGTCLERVDAKIVFQDDMSLCSKTAWIMDLKKH